MQLSPSRIGDNLNPAGHLGHPMSILAIRIILWLSMELPEWDGSLTRHMQMTPLDQSARSGTARLSVIAMEAQALVSTTLDGARPREAFISVSQSPFAAVRFPSASPAYLGTLLLLSPEVPD